jgi:poly(3-hydroxybutyrate) depolymerase
MRRLTIALIAGLLALTTTASDSDPVQRMEDAGFEDVRPGKLETTTDGKFSGSVV